MVQYDILDMPWICFLHRFAKLGTEPFLIRHDQTLISILYNFLYWFQLENHRKKLAAEGVSD